MTSPRLLAAVFGVLALASANASGATDSSSFLVSLRIAAPCDVATDAAAPGRGVVTVHCQSPSTPYRLEQGTRGPEPPARVEGNDETEGYTRATLTF